MFTIKDGVKLKIERVAGADAQDCEISATSSTAAVKGLCWLIQETAQYLKMTKEELLCRVAVVLMGPKKEVQRS